MIGKSILKHLNIIYKIVIRFRRRNGLNQRLPLIKDNMIIVFAIMAYNSMLIIILYSIVFGVKKGK